MSDQSKYTALPGTDRKLVPRARIMGPANGAESMQVTVYLRRAASSPGGPACHPATDGCTQADIDAVAAFARQNSLTVKEANRDRRNVKLTGCAADIRSAFQVELWHCEMPDGRRMRLRQGAVWVPRELAGIVEGVFGLDTRPPARSYLSKAPHLEPFSASTSESRKVFTPIELARLYGFPENLDGSGQTIAIIELGGGVIDGDLLPNFRDLGLTPPDISIKTVDGGRNEVMRVGGEADVATGEVMLDIVVAGAIAPKSKLVVYFAELTDQGFLNAVSQAVQDRASIISISWGQAESCLEQQMIRQFNGVLLDASNRGITVCASAGDDGSRGERDDDGCGMDTLAHVGFPASSPFILACGGSTLLASGSRIDSEVVWNDGLNHTTGGGVSDQFDVPSWQQDAGVPPSGNPGGRRGRGVPDVCAHAAGYAITFDGKPGSVFTGSSAVAPLWAGLIALLNQRLGRPVGFLNPALYRSATAFRDVLVGTNGIYNATRGWDPCTGLGSPNGAALFDVLR